ASGRRAKYADSRLDEAFGVSQTPHKALIVPTARRAIGRLPGILTILGLVAPMGVGCGPGKSAQVNVIPVEGLPVSAGAESGPIDIDLPEPRPEEPERSPIRFRDITDSSGIEFTHVSGNSPEKHYPTGNGSGVAMLDYDGDGRLDLYFATTRNLPLDAPTASRGNRLYRNRGDESFEDVTERAGVGFRGFCHGVAVARAGTAEIATTNRCAHGR